MFRISAVSGLVVSLLMMLGVTFALAMIVASGKMEALSTVGLFSLHAASVFVGSLVSGRKAKSRGWLHGLLNAVLYVAVLGMIGFLGFDRSVGMPIIWLLVLASFTGVVGGSVGVNRRE
jgi:putative membrane protein (TIGR04086 family)